MKDADIVFVFITASNEAEAATIGTTLVMEQLAACCSLVKGVRSIYRWEGKLCDETECLMLVKTTAARYPDLEKRVVSLHSYDVPEILALPVSEGLKPYLAWLSDATQAIA